MDDGLAHANAAAAAKPALNERMYAPSKATVEGVTYDAGSAVST